MDKQFIIFMIVLALALIAIIGIPIYIDNYNETHIKTNDKTYKIVIKDTNIVYDKCKVLDKYNYRNLITFSVFDANNKYIKTVEYDGDYSITRKW
jgi:hypothetical protein